MINKSLPVRRHEILGLNCAQCDDLNDIHLSIRLLVRLMDGMYLFICSSVAHNTDGLHGQQHRKRLADLVVQACRADLRDEDVVGMLQNFDLLASNRPKNADRQAGSRERVSLHERSRDSKQPAEGTNFVYGRGPIVRYWSQL